MEILKPKTGRDGKHHEISISNQPLTYFCEVHNQTKGIWRGETYKVLASGGGRTTGWEVEMILILFKARTTGIDVFVRACSDLWVLFYANYDSIYNKKIDIIQSSEILEDILLRSQGKKPREASTRLIII